MASGLRWFIVDDDFFKMFPKDLDSRLLWEDMVDEFGDSEFLLIAFGEKDRDVYNQKTLNKVVPLSKTEIRTLKKIKIGIEELLNSIDSLKN